MGSDVETNGGGIGVNDEAGVSHPNFEAIAETAEEIAELATDPGVRRLAKLMAKAMKTAIVVRGPKGDVGPSGDRGERGAPGAPDLGPVGTDRERLQWMVKSLVEIEGNAAAGDWSPRSRASLRDARQSLMKAIGAVASLDEMGTAGAVRALDPAPRTVADEPVPTDPAFIRTREHREFERREPRDARGEDREEKGGKKRRRNTLPVLGHGEVDSGD